MSGILVQKILNLFSGMVNGSFGKELLVFIISCLPILELRGGLIAASMLSLNPITSFIICFIGTMLPVPFILLFITPLFNKLKKTKSLSKLVNKIETKALNKKEKIEKYEFWGLVLFVGIPLPGTGAWTGSLIASLLNLDKKKSFLAVLLGTLMAAIIMMILSFGLLKTIV